MPLQKHGENRWPSGQVDRPSAIPPGALGGGSPVAAEGLANLETAETGSSEYRPSSALSSKEGCADATSAICRNAAKAPVDGKWWNR